MSKKGYEASKTLITPDSTPVDAKNAHLDAVKASLSGLTKDEIIDLLAEALTGKRNT